MMICLGYVVMNSSINAQSNSGDRIIKDLQHRYKSLTNSAYSDKYQQTSIKCEQFSKKLIQYLSKYPITLKMSFKELEGSGVYVATSTDKLFRIYSWDTWSGGTMHFFANVCQFFSGDQTYNKVFTFEEGDPSCYYSDIATLMIGNKKVYVAQTNAIYSSHDFEQSLRFFSIENSAVIDTLKLIKSKDGLTNVIEIGDEYFAESVRPDIIPVKYDAVEKQIYIPIVNNDGTSGQCVIYQFNGEYFAKVEPSGPHL